jgi:tRNA1Val (adenine37-N6)-methyltransferase
MPYQAQELLFNMGNHFFKFKQFTVYQDQCAMKVCTDACVQGAFTAGAGVAKQADLVLPVLQQADLLSPFTVLDIGAGTGLLSLMLAQAWPNAIFTAVELDTAAAQQAAANFAASPWSSRLHVIQGDALDLPPAEYDFIISNPPFYEADLKSPDRLRNQAMHATTLDYANLLDVIDKQLAPTGSFSVLLPYAPFAGFVKQAAIKGFHPSHILQVQQSVKHTYFRTVGIFSRQPQQTITTDLSIRNANNQYTPAFAALLSSYYLAL